MSHFLKDNPDIALFACLSLGYALGRVHVGRIQIGGICGTLIVALVVGTSGVQLDPEVKSIAFALFIFTLGYTGGPQFFANLNRRGLRYAIFPAIEVVAALSVTALAIVILDLDRGTASGLLAGGATESAMVGTATEAIGKLDLPAAQISALQANVATAYTISYLCGLITIVLFTSQIAPALLRIDLRAEASKLLARLGGGPEDPDSAARPALPELVGRAHRVTVADGRTVAAVESALGAGATVEQLRRDGARVPVAPDAPLRAGDELLLVGPRAALIGAGAAVGPEVPGEPGDGALELDSADVVFNHRDLDGRTIDELTAMLPASERHGVFLTGVTRMEHPLPVEGSLPLQDGDVVRVTGRRADLASVVSRIGYAIDATVKIDFIYLGAGIVAGILIGKLTVQLGDVPLSLGTGGGALLSGLGFGWLRARHPTFGAYHPAAAQVVKEFGLATFIVATGLAAGPQAGSLIRQYGVALPVAGVLLTLIPASISLLVGRRLLRLEPPLLLGAVAGQQCSTPAITALQQQAGNATPLISYTIVYALANVILPLLGPVIVALTGTLGS